MQSVISYPSIIVPRRRKVILSRPRLLKLFENYLDHQLVMLVSPPGYGKTSLLVDFARASSTPVCWYTIGAYDQEPSRFLAHFTAAIAARFPGFGQTTETFLNNLKGITGSLETFLHILVNELHQHANQRFILILDDFHHVDEQPVINAFLSRFLERTGEACCLVIASRRRPGLDVLNRLAAYDQAASLTEIDLAFRGDEIQAMACQNYQIAVSDKDANELAERTEGWITGLLLSNPAGWEARAAQLRAISGHVAHLERYWAHLLSEQPAEVVDFLLYASLLDDFSAGLCAEAFAPLYPQGADWQGLFEAVLHYNLFVQAIDQNGGWLHLHSLLREYLQARLKAEKPAEYAILLGRLVQVYLQHSEWEKAYACQEQLGNVEDLASLIEQVGTPMIRSGRYDAVTRWIESLHPQVLESRPGLLSLKGITATIGPNIADALPLLDQAVALFNERHDIPMLGRSLARRGSVRQYLGHYQEALNDAVCLLSITRRQPDLLALRTEAFGQCGINLRFLGKPRRAERYLRKALELYICLEYDFNAASIHHNLGLALRALGHYKQAEWEYEQALAYWRTIQDRYRMADVLNDLGILHHYSGDFATACSTYSEAIELARNCKYVRMEAFLLSSLGTLYADVDAFIPANTAYRQARRLAEQIQHRYLAFYLDCSEAALARRQNDFPTAWIFLESARELAENGKSDSEQAAYLCEVGLVLLAEGDAQAAVERFTQSLQIYQQRGWMLEQALLGLYHAVALAMLGQTKQTGEQLHQALEVHRQLDEPRCMVSEGRLVKTLLAKQQTNPLAARFLEQVEAFEMELPALRRQTLQQSAVEGISTLPRLVILALGKAQIEVDGRLISETELQKTGGREIIFYLISQPSGLSRRELANLFFPNLESGRQNASVRNAVYRLSLLLGESAILRQNEQLAFNRQADYAYDVEQFLGWLDKARQAGDPMEQIELYTKASAIYQGPYLPNFNGSWVMPEREYLRQGYLEAMLMMGEIRLALGEHIQALEYIYQLLKQEPCLEPAHCLAMRIHAARGSRVDVIRQYQQCEYFLAEHLNTKPSLQTREVYQTLIQ